MKEYSKTELILKIYNRLHMRPLTIKSLKQWLDSSGIECSERSLYRYLDELTQHVSLIGEEIEVSYGEKNQKVWKLILSRSSYRLDTTDINSLYMFFSFAPAAVQTPRKTSFEKIEMILHSQISKNNLVANINSTQSHIHNTNFQECNYSKIEHELLDVFIDSIENKNQIRIKDSQFDITGNPIRDTINKPLNPIKIIYHRGTLHVCFSSDFQEELLVLALEQIKEIEVLCSTFLSKGLETKFKSFMRNRFGITTNMDDLIHDIEIEFSEETGNFVSMHFWHHSQKFTQLPSKNWLLKMRCGINRELVGWIMMWMSNAMVRKPTLLKNIVVNKIKETLNTQLGSEVLVSNNTFRKSD